MSDALHHVNPDLERLLVPLEELRPDDQNARRHTARNLDAIMASYREFGQQKPLVVMTDGRVVAGNGQLEAAHQLGWTHIAVVRFSDEQKARAFAIADNRSGELAEWDEAQLLATLTDLRDEGVDVEGILAFDAAEMGALAGRGAGPPDGFKEFGQDVPTDYSCPKCGYAWSGPAKAGG